MRDRTGSRFEIPLGTGPGEQRAPDYIRAWGDDKQDPDSPPSGQVMHPRRQLAETPLRTFQHRRRFGGQLQRRQGLFFGPTRQGVSRDLPAGLANLGNTCYINAALQASAHASPSQLETSL